MLGQSAQWIWLAVTLAGLVVVGYVVMKWFRFGMKEIARRTSRQNVLDTTLLQGIDEISGGIRVAVIAVGMILGGFFILRALGHPAVAGRDPSFLVGWFLDRGVRIILLLAAGYLCIKLSHMVTAKVGLLIRPYDATPAAGMERDKRAQTLSAILRKFATVVILALTALMLLGELNVNTTPILTSLGVVGVALGFGAQQLVRDLIAGFFLIFENQIRVGDIAIINGTAGLVQEIRLRTTVLRAVDGTVHVFQNGSINTLSNMTKDYSYFVLDLPVAYKEDTDRVCRVVSELGAEMQTDATFKPLILEPAEILGVEEFKESSLIIKLRIKTMPTRQFDVGREFRRRLKYRFDQEGIEIPTSKPFLLTPSSLVTQVPASGPAETGSASAP